MNDEAIRNSLTKALALLSDADLYLTDGDEIDEIEEEGSPEVARWAQQVRSLLAENKDLVNEALFAV